MVADHHLVNQGAQEALSALQREGFKAPERQPAEFAHTVLPSSCGVMRGQLTLHVGDLLLEPSLPPANLLEAPAKARHLQAFLQVEIYEPLFLAVQLGPLAAEDV